MASPAAYGGAECDGGTSVYPTPDGLVSDPRACRCRPADLEASDQWRRAWAGTRAAGYRLPDTPDPCVKVVKVI